MGVEASGSARRERGDASWSLQGASPKSAPARSTRITDRIRRERQWERPIPPERLLLSREDAWDGRTVELDSDGRFAVDGLPTERYTLSVALKGYAISTRNHSTDPQNPYRLVGAIDQDLDGLKILIEPKPR